MRLGAAQIFVSDVLEENLKNILRKMDEGGRRQIDLLAFPEMCLTSYNPGILTREGIEDEISLALEEIRQKAKETGVGVIIGHGARSRGGELSNTASVLLPDGSEHSYKKIYVTEAEADHFKAGTDPLSFSYQDKKFGVIVCRDQNYPDLAQKVCGQDADALFILSGHFYHPQVARWKKDKNKAMPIARAVENKVHVIMANAVGNHVHIGQDTLTRGLNVGLQSLGTSMIVDPQGGVVVMADESSETILTCDV